jgi:hypothetical protein
VKYFMPLALATPAFTDLYQEWEDAFRYFADG